MRPRADTVSAGPALCGRSGLLLLRVCLSPLWLNSGRRRASPTSQWSWVSSRAAYRRARSPARIATVVLVGCSGAGSGWCCRAWIADCTVYLGGPATVGAGPLMCADCWAVTVWRIASAARLRRSRGHGLCAATQTPTAWHHCGCSLGQAWYTGPSARARAVPGPTDTVRVSHSPAHRSLRATARPPFATSTGQRPPLLRQDLADSDAGPGAGSRGHRDQRSRYATSRTLAPPSRACTSMTDPLEPRPHLGPRPLIPAAGVNTHTPP